MTTYLYFVRGMPDGIRLTSHAPVTHAVLYRGADQKVAAVLTNRPELETARLRATHGDDLECIVAVARELVRWTVQP